jgi:hypothetical protein
LEDTKYYWYCTYGSNMPGLRGGSQWGVLASFEQKLKVLLLPYTLLYALVVLLEMWMYTQNDIPQRNNWIRVKDNHVNGNQFARAVCIFFFRR